MRIISIQSPEGSVEIVRHENSVIVVADEHAPPDLLEYAEETRKHLQEALEDLPREPDDLRVYFESC